MATIDNNNSNNNSNLPDERKFVACFMNKTNWNCNSEFLNFRDSHQWLKINDKNSNYTTIIPFSCNIFMKYTPKPLIEFYVNSQLKKISKTKFIN